MSIDPELPDRIARALYEWQRNEPHVLDDNYPDKRCLCCNPGGAADVIREALSTQSVAAVLALHKPVQRWFPRGVFYVTEHEPREGYDDTFTVCDECARLEAGWVPFPDKDDYEDSMWPCRTARACGIAEASG